MKGSGIPYALLILIGLHVVSANVPPPINVTLYCHNMQNTLRWSYEDQSPGLRFSVYVGSTISDPVSLLVDAQYIDLSKFSDPNNDYMVMVSAVNGSEKSDPVPEDGIEFSYFKDSPAKQKCSVDLPLVNVTALEDKQLHYSFKHPGLLYPLHPKLRRKKSSENMLPVFSYHVEIMNQKEAHKHYCDEEVCERLLPVSSNEEIYCLNITGEMRKMSVRATKKYCSKPLKPHRINVLAYVIPIVLVLVGGIIIALMVYIKKTKPSTSVPRPLHFGHSRMVNSEQNGTSPMSEISGVEVSLRSPAPLLTPEQVPTSTSYEDELRLPLGVPSTDNVQQREEGESQDAGYTGGADLENNDDGDEEAGRDYEQRPCLSISEQDDSAQSNV